MAEECHYMAEEHSYMAEESGYMMQFFVWPLCWFADARTALGPFINLK